MVLFTYVLKSVVEGRSDVAGASRAMEAVSKNNAPWILGLEPASLPSLLKQFHLDLLADVGNADYQATYLRPLGRSLEVSDAERVAHAVVVPS